MSKRCILWLILIPILSFSCSAERGDWKKAKSQHSIEAYKEYLAKHPEGKHAVEAKEKITELYYEQAVSAHTIEAYQDFLAKYPEGLYAGRAKVKISELHYEQAESMNTIEAYQDFLAKDPEGIGALRAKVKITELYYEQATSANTIEAYEEFLKRYPSGKLSQAANNKIEQLFYEQARSENLISSYENYLERYPKGRFVGEAKEGIRKKESGPIDAAVVDDDGHSFPVRGLKAYYEAYGTWHPKTPTDLVAYLKIVLYDMEGYTPKAKMNVFFSDIRRIDFKKEERMLRKNIYIQKWDDSSVTILLLGNPYIVREKDSNGKTTKEMKSDKIFFSTGNIQGEEIHLRGFKGQIEGPDGQEREYYIDYPKVRSIVFEKL
jgi:outer membrane protein assembly factor BamD (BamD/ComL family)